jgi:hypothetical protein
MFAPMAVISWLPAEHPDTGREYVEEETWTAELIAQAPLYDPDWLPVEHKEEERKAKSASEGERQYQFDDEDEFVAQHFHNIAVPPDERRRQAEVYLTAVPGTTQGTGKQTHSSPQPSAKPLQWGGGPAQRRRRWVTKQVTTCCHRKRLLT